MANIFEDTFIRVQELKEIVNHGTDEAAKDAARLEYGRLMDAVEALGGPGRRIWREYEAARLNGNTRLDLNDVIWDREVEGLVSCMRENGIEEFTFSSGWSSSVEIGWLFVQNGCRVAGMAEVQGSMDYFEGRRTVKHGYVLQVAGN